MFIQGIKGNYNGQQFSVFGDSDFIIYSSRGFKNTWFGQGSDFAWSKTDYFATKILPNIIKIYKGTEEIKSLKINDKIDSLFGGELLWVKWG